jgi:serine beta-lactamase-like protein LACTB
MRDRHLSTIRWTAFVAAAAISCHPPRIVPSATAASDQQDAAARFVDSLARTQRLPGLSVTVSVGRSVVFEHGTGFADVEARIPATGVTRYRIGSVSKLLTATALMRLAQTGRLELDAPLARYVTVPPALGAVTLRQLAGHLGGVRHYRGNEFLSNAHYDALTDALGVFANDSLVATPGTRYSYSSYGYNLLGVAIERSTGLPFPDALRRHVLDPLGLEATVPDIKGARIADRRGSTRFPVMGSRRLPMTISADAGRVADICRRQTIWRGLGGRSLRRDSSVRSRSRQW